MLRHIHIFLNMPSLQPQPHPPQKMAAIQARTADERRKLQAQYAARLEEAEGKIRTLTARQRELLQMKKLKERAEELCNKLQVRRLVVCALPFALRDLAVQQAAGAPHFVNCCSRWSGVALSFMHVSEAS